MKKFIRKSLVYISIILLYICTGEFILFKMKENYPLRTIINKQINSKREYYFERRLFGNNESLYKYLMLQQQKPDIITFGQSIVLQFRGYLFHPNENKYYNTGLMARNTNDVEYVIKQIKENKIKTPKFIIYGLDFGIVKAGNELNNNKWIENSGKDRVFVIKSHFRNMQKIFLKMHTYKIPHEHLGFGILGSTGEGYRKEGSYHRKHVIVAYFKDSIHHGGEFYNYLVNRHHPFTYPMDVDTIRKNILKNCFSEFRNMGIELLIYVSPLSDDFYSKAIQDPDFKHFWDGYMKFQDELIAQDFNIIKFCTPSQIGLNDLYMLDSDHPSEVMIAKQFVDYCNEHPNSIEYLKNIDLNYTDSLLNDKRTIPVSFMMDTLVNFSN